MTTQRIIKRNCALLSGACGLPLIALGLIDFFHSPGDALLLLSLLLYSTFLFPKRITACHPDYAWWSHPTKITRFVLRILVFTLIGALWLWLCITPTNQQALLATHSPLAVTILLLSLTWLFLLVVSLCVFARTSIRRATLSE
ncbi:hypothetical protein ACWX0P_17570 [Vibrio mediterranei]